MTAASHHKVIKKAGLARKKELAERVRDALKRFRYSYVVEHSHIKTSLMQQIRDALKPSGHVFMTKNRILQRALGVSPETSAEEGTYRLSGLVEGSVCLVCTSLTEDELRATVQPLLETARGAFAVAGGVSPTTVVLSANEQPLADYPFSMETQFRALGAPTHLDNGKILLLGDHQVCGEGEVLNKHQAQMLKLLGYSLAAPTFTIKASHNKRGARVALARNTVLHFSTTRIATSPH